MITIRDVYRLQSEFGVADGSFSDSEIDFEQYLNNCRMFLAANFPKGYDTMSPEDKKNQTITLISQFVNTHKVAVKGYVSRDTGAVNLDLLVEDLVDAVTGLHILKEALEDPAVDEIQINDKDTIFVSKEGRLHYYTDSKGRIKRFHSDDEILILLNRLIDDGTGTAPMLTDGKPILNAKTAKEQYRISAVHPVANARAKPPHNFPITSVVIRKFKEVKLTVADLVRNQALTEQMGRLLQLLGRADVKLFCVGPTGSGKTTLVNIIAETIPLNKRILLIQNPTEISFMERDHMGRNRRNVVHWEVGDSASMDALISNSLRFTPEVVIIGEMREGEEFYQGLRIMSTGHKVIGTFHAEDSSDAIIRYASEVAARTHGNKRELQYDVAKAIDIIVSQYRFDNGRRRVTEISEIIGVDDNGDVVINPLFEFQLTGEVIPDEETGLEEICGNFVQVNPMSAKLRMKCFKAGITAQAIKEFCDFEPKRKLPHWKGEIW